MSVPQRQAGGEKLWDDLDAETFGDHDGSAALSNWAEQAKAFEAEMQAMRKAGGGKLPGEPVGNCVEINQCVGCTRQLFTKSFLGDDVAVLARSSGEEPASPRHRAGVASMAWRSTR